MRVITAALLAALMVPVLAACTEEGAVNKARQTREQELRQEQQRELERSRIIQDTQRPALPSTR